MIMSLPLLKFIVFFICLCFNMVSFRGQKSLGHAQIGLVYGFYSKFPTSIRTTFICGVPPPIPRCFQRDSYYVDINVVVTFQCVYSILSYYHKELHRDIQLSRSQTSANSKRGSNTGHNTLWDKVKLIYRDRHCCCFRLFQRSSQLSHCSVCIPLISWFLLLDH